MKILVINTGSSSIKYQLFDMNSQRSLASGLAERIGETTGVLTHRITTGRSNPAPRIKEGKIANHHEGLEQIAALLVDPEHGVIRDKSEIAAVGHRVVHGGETFQSPTIINEEVISAIEENISLAPLHNPPNLEGINVARHIFPDAPQVAVFDTAFHQTIPKEAYLYALPYELYEKHRIRKYGFHGTSHAYVAERTARYLGRSPDELNLITIHLGNGASMAAIKKGRCVDTSMGLTPLAGLVMGTRSGDVDPALPFFLADLLDMSLQDIDELLNKKSGLKGICGDNDMRGILLKKNNGDPRAALALDVYTYRIKKYIGAFWAVLGRLDGLVFTAGIGENSPEVRDLCCRGLSGFGIEIDPDKNSRTGDEVREINTQTGRVKILVVPTDEELKIAQETQKVIEAAS